MTAGATAQAAPRAASGEAVGSPSPREVGAEGGLGGCFITQAAEGAAYSLSPTPRATSAKAGVRGTQQAHSSTPNAAQFRTPRARVAAEDKAAAMFPGQFR